MARLFKNRLVIPANAGIYNQISNRKEHKTHKEKKGLGHSAKINDRLKILAGSKIPYAAPARGSIPALHNNAHCVGFKLSPYNGRCYIERP